MSNTKVELISEGFRALLTSPEISDAVADKAKEIANKAGAGYGSDIRSGAGRAVARVYPETAAAKRDNRKKNTLLKAMQS